MTVYWNNELNGNYFYAYVDSPNIVRDNLFSFSTKVIVVDPTVFKPNLTYSNPQVLAQQVTFTNNFTYVSAKLLDSSWSSNGWDMGNKANFLNQLKIWADNNLVGGSLNIPVGYNLKMSKIAYPEEPLETYSNSSLVPFSYDPIDGIVTYSTGANLVNVTAGNYFVDGQFDYYLITDVNVSTRQLTIRDITSGNIPLSISTTVTDEFQGSCTTATEPTIKNYTVAFFYPGNQGTPL